MKNPSKLRQLVISGIAWFIDYAWLFLLLILLLLIITPTVIFWRLQIPFTECVYVSLSALMGDSPGDVLPGIALTGVEEALLFLLRVAGWLILPIVVSLVIEKGQSEFDKRQRELLATEERLSWAEKELTKSIKELTEAGWDKEQAQEFVAALDAEIQKAVDDIGNEGHSS